MAAVLGIPAEKAASAVEALGKEGVFVANHNAPAQVVISGTADGLAKAEAALKAAGARRIVRLSVSGPFHSPLMAEARHELDAALVPFTFSDPRLPVYSNVTGKAIRTGAEAKELCGKQLVSTVRWVAVEQSLLADGFDRFLETGPGTVLAGLFRGLSPEAKCSAAGTLEGIAEAAEDSR